VFVAEFPTPIREALTVAGNEPLLVGCPKEKMNGGGVVTVTVEVVTVAPLVVVDQTPLLGVTVCAPTGAARQPAERRPKNAKRPELRCIINEDRPQTELTQSVSRLSTKGLQRACIADCNGLSLLRTG
jgi:hypothetical protein